MSLDAALPRKRLAHYRHFEVGLRALGHVVAKALVFHCAASAASNATCSAVLISSFIMMGIDLVQFVLVYAEIDDFIFDGQPVTMTPESASPQHRLPSPRHSGAIC